MRSTRIVAVAAVVVLAAIIAGAVTLVATANGSNAVVPSHLHVPAGPPTTATGVLTYSDSNGIQAHVDCAFDFPAGTAQLDATASLSVASVSVSARLVDRVLYFYVPQFTSLVGAPWVSTSALHGPARLEDLARSMRHPDLSRFHAARTVVRQADGTTATTLRFGLVRVPFAASSPIPLPPAGRLTVVVVTGTQGQLLDVRLTLVGVGGDTVHLNYETTGYDQPVAIVAPPASQVARLTPAKARELFGTDTQNLQHLLGDLHHAVG